MTAAPRRNQAPPATLLICTDLDRTLIPNGPQAEYPGARERFASFVARPGIRLAYVSGRHLELVLAALVDYELPRPDYIIADVGTSILRADADRWLPLRDWREVLTPDWGGVGPEGIAALLADIRGPQLQEAEKQGPFKLSYYLPMDLEPRTLLAGMRERLQAHGLRVNLVHSLDEPRKLGLLDILPAGASKRHAIEFLLDYLNLTAEDCVFAGDSGNDLEVLASPIPAVLVANAAPEIRAEARALAARAGHGDKLYCAKGGYAGRNGHYADGILEGIAYFHPGLVD